MKKYIIGIIAAAIIIPFAVYTVSPIFTSSTIDEALPEGVITVDSSMSDNDNNNMMMDDDDKEHANMMKDDDDDMMMMMDDDDKEHANMMMDDDDKEHANMMMDDDEEHANMMKDDNQMINKNYFGTFVGVDDGIHNAEGIAKVLPLNDGSQVLRLEEFSATNGPDLYVYLSTDIGDSDFVSLGKLKANNGNQNYEIPDGTDLEKYNQVLIWCKPFSQLFGNAMLTPTN